MKDLSFAHVTHFQHRHFHEANHDFQLHHPALFLEALCADMGAEADNPAPAMQYRAQHRHTLDFDKCWMTDLLTTQLDNVRRALLPRRSPSSSGRKSMPKHIFVSNEYRSSGDQGIPLHFAVVKTCLYVVSRLWIGLCCDMRLLADHLVRLCVGLSMQAGSSVQVPIRSLLSLHLLESFLTVVC